MSKVLNREFEKITLRVAIPELTCVSMKQAYEYFEKLIGIPDDLDGDEETIWHFAYDLPTYPGIRKVNDFFPIHELKTGKWALDYLLYYRDVRGKEYGTKELKPVELQAKKEKLAQMVEADIQDVILRHSKWKAYEDEPVHI